jgi:predicted DNA-binding protein (UPF0251 family)
MTQLEEVVLPVEGYEALRLVDVEGLDQDQAAARMEVSRPTFGRILAAARKTLALAVVLGRALRIDGGNWAVETSPDGRPPCCPRNQAGRKGKGKNPSDQQEPLEIKEGSDES